jgi:4-amino-4-deoxy-L-arabinose transferase-like glycosyltransferase
MSTTVAGRQAPRHSERAREGTPHTVRLALTLLTLLALALRVTHLGRSLFTDEAYSLALAQRGFGHMLGLFGYEANGMPYPLVLWPLIRVFGTGEAVLRAPAVLAGTASVPALWWAARRLGYRETVALGAAALLALNPMAIWYSQEARPYALVMLASCLAFGALPGVLRPETVPETAPVPAPGRDGPRGGRSARGQRGGVRTVAGYVAAMALLGYSDLLALPIALPAQALIARRAGRKGVRRWLCSLAAVLVCCMPLILAAVIARGRRNALYWLPKLSRSLVEGAVQEFTGGLSGVSAVRWVTVLAVAVLVGAALWRLRKAHTSPEATTDSASHTSPEATTDSASHTSAETAAAAAASLPRFRLAVAGTWGLVPPALLLAVSAVEPVFWPRYAILALPGLCLLVAEAAGQLWAERPGARAMRTGAAAAAACLVAIAVAGLVADVRQQSVLQEDWPPAVAWLRTTRMPSEAVVVDNALVLPSLGYYDPAFRAPDGVMVVQEWHDRHLPAGFVGYKDPTGYGSVPQGPPAVRTVRKLARQSGGSVWMVVSEVDERLQGGDPRTGAAVAWARGHCHVQVRENVGVWVLHATGCSVFDTVESGRAS